MALADQIRMLAQQEGSGFGRRSPWPVLNSYNANIADENRVEVRFETNPHKFVLHEKGQGPFVRRLYSLNAEEAAGIAHKLDQTYATTNYRTIINNANWQSLFQVSTRTVAYIRGTDTIAQDEPTLPCYLCGLVLPLSHMTIDHTKPQAGGEHQALIKALRNINEGLTHDTGVGALATSYRTATFAPLPTKLGSPGVDHSDRVEHRYTLTERGMLFLSIAVAASDLNTLLRYGMHSFFNLKPYCSKCNIKKSNLTVDLSWIND